MTLSRRLLRHGTEVLWLAVAVVAGWLLWPSSLGGCTTLTIVSGASMEPTYYTGDLVVSRCGEVAVGDVIVYEPSDVGGARVIHRVVGGTAEDGWVMQGDNNDFEDPWQPTGDAVLGHAVFHVSQVGRFASILLSPMTWVSLLLIALALVLWPQRPEDAKGSGGGPDAGADADADADAGAGPVDPLPTPDDPAEPATVQPTTVQPATVQPDLVTPRSPLP